MTVNRERVKLLVDALRSGEFEQGQSYLTQIFRNMSPDGSFGEEYKPRKNCCLGVGCVVAMKHGASVVANEQDAVGHISYYDPTHFRQHEDLSDTHLPYVVRDWYGFDDTNPTLLMPRKFARALVADGRMHDSVFDANFPTLETEYAEFDATDCNDDLRMTFDEIADAFERTYLA